jgi:hypothetical protein
MEQHRLPWMEHWTTGIGRLDDEHRGLADYYQGVVDALCNDGEDNAFVGRLKD